MRFPNRLHNHAARLTTVLLFLIGGLALTRILYETLFPRALWLAQPFPVLIIAGIGAIVGALGRTEIVERMGGPWTATAVFLPLALNLFYLPQTAVDPLRGAFLLLGSLWLTALLLSYSLYPNAGRWRDALFLLGFLIPVYLLTMGRTVGEADTFEFQVVIPQLEIAHPTGYPLYILLTKWFTLLPFGSMAWRVNVGTAVYALAACYLLYALISRLTGQRLAGVLTAVLFGLSPTFWSQAVKAEVYALHALIVITALLLMREIGGWQLGERESGNGDRRLPILLAFVLGLGLTNHLTTVILIPPALLTLFLARKQLATRRLPLAALAAFLLPLILYAYLPIRWQALHGEPMGAARFVDWVVASRFRGSLHLDGWLSDTGRYAILGRLFSAEWGGVALSIAAAGFVLLAVKQWRAALVFGLTWLGFSFYALNYYVADLAVFLIPAHIVLAIGVGVFFAGVNASGLKGNESHRAAALLVLVAAMGIFLTTAVGESWRLVDQSQNDGLIGWGKGVLALPLAENGAILADSEKIAPLYYLQRAEGVRPDLEIMVLPDEAAYRAELDARLAAGQAVYLARYLPGLEGIYHLGSMGPLTAVSTTPLTQLPLEASAAAMKFDGARLIGYALEAEAAVDEEATAVTLYWQASDPIAPQLRVYTRWGGGAPTNPAGQYPVDNNYPINAWKGDEIVADFHLLPHPLLTTGTTRPLQVAIAPQFTPPEKLAWQTIAEVALPPTGSVENEWPLRMQFEQSTLNGVAYPDRARPQTALSVLLGGFGDPAITLQLGDVAATPEGSDWTANAPFVTAVELETGNTNGRFSLIAPDATVCGWLRVSGDGCTLGEIEISGVPLPADAINYDDKIGLLEIGGLERPLQTGEFPIDLKWQALESLREDYTIFIQILDANDQIVGQVDSWPLQGTYPTSQWTPGEIIEDSHVIYIETEPMAAPYRLLVGWYLLADLRRLPIVDENGALLDDKTVIYLDGE